MKPFYWNEAKNQKLKKERGVCFEDAIEAITEGKILGEYAGKGKYAHQKYYILSIKGYPYVAPYVEDEEKIFLKTVFPNRIYKHLMAD